MYQYLRASCPSLSEVSWVDWIDHKANDVISLWFRISSDIPNKSWPVSIDWEQLLAEVQKWSLQIIRDQISIKASCSNITTTEAPDWMTFRPSLDHWRGDANR